MCSQKFWERVRRDAMCYAKDRRKHILSASVNPQVGEMVWMAAPGPRIQDGKAMRLALLVWYPLSSHGCLWRLSKLLDAPCCLSVFRFGFSFLLKWCCQILHPCSCSEPAPDMTAAQALLSGHRKQHIPEKLWIFENNCYFTCISSSCLTQEPGEEPNNAFNSLIRYCLKWLKISRISISMC